MRTKSIIYIIRRYGLSSKRLSPKGRIKYEDAIKGLEGYENSELRIADVIDNVLFPHKSVSCKCQIPGCNHRIRYEYVLENKESHERFVAGSTCVWPTLGLSELQKKEFLTFENVVKEYHDMIQWRKENPDIIEKLEKAKQAKLNQFRPFWEEIDHCRLMEEDEEYIRSTDIDKIIRAKEENDRKRDEYRRMTEEQRRRNDEEYQKVLDGLNSLVEFYPDNDFYKSLQSTVSHGFRLSANQVRYVKIGCNKRWYEKNIKNTPKNKMYDDCEKILGHVFSENGFRGKDSDRESIKRMNDIMITKDSILRLAWSLFKVKYSIVL